MFAQLGRSKAACWCDEPVCPPIKTSNLPQEAAASCKHQGRWWLPAPAAGRSCRHYGLNPPQSSVPKVRREGACIVAVILST